MQSLTLVSILWIDDDKPFLDRTGMIFRNEGFGFSGATSGKEGIGKIKKNSSKYNLVVTDLDMPYMDGIDVFNEIRRIGSKIPVGFASAHFGEYKWERRLKALGIKVLRIEKPIPMVTSEDFKKIIEEIIDLIKLNGGREKDQLRPFNPPRDKFKENPFRLSLTEFKDLTDDKKDQAFEEASILNLVYIKKHFKNHPEEDWIVIAEEPGNIIASGKAQDEPFQEDLEKLATKYKKPVFTYSRPKIIEETEPCRWSCKSRSGLDPADFYPTVAFDFGYGKRIDCDFDTGSEVSFLSYEELLKRGIINKKIWAASSSVLWGESYSYYRLKLKCKLIGKIKNKDIELKCEGIKDWKTSPQVKNFKNRLGLIGRHLMIDNKIRLVLDGEKKETDIL